MDGLSLTKQEYIWKYTEKYEMHNTFGKRVLLFAYTFENLCNGRHETKNVC